MRNRVIALIITFFGGAFGLHKFYLGNNFAGIIYFIFSWTFIPTILAFFDFLGLVFISDRDFDRQFNGGTETTRVLEQPRVVFSNPQKQSSKEVAETLGELKKLYDNGIITAEEYETKRRKLLDSI